jgi:hypothetical protein
VQHHVACAELPGGRDAIRAGDHEAMGDLLTASRAPISRHVGNVALMIAKTYSFAKTFGTYAIRILREAKSLRDHVSTLSGISPDG